MHKIISNELSHVEDRIEVSTPWYFGLDGWRKLQKLQHDAFVDEMITKPESEGLSPIRSMNEIGYLTMQGRLHSYYYSHEDPNNEIGKRFAENQSFHNQKVAVAYQGDEPIGFMYLAHNVSGKKLTRGIKRTTFYKDYLWLREVAIKAGEEYRGNGLASRLGRAVLHGENETRSVATYVWPEETPEIIDILHAKGFVLTDETERPVFGENSRPTLVQRYQAVAGRLLANL